jgi:hypothetical protein
LYPSNSASKRALLTDQINQSIKTVKKIAMKKQFAIKVAQVSKNISVAAAKNESANMLKFMKPIECCQAWSIQGLIRKPAFSL